VTKDRPEETAFLVSLALVGRRVTSDHVVFRVPKVSLDSLRIRDRRVNPVFRASADLLEQLVWTVCPDRKEIRENVLSAFQAFRV